MDSKLVSRIRKHMEHEHEERLLRIWSENDTDEWSPEAFEAVRQILTEREVSIPPQSPPRSTAPADSFPLAIPLLLIVVASAFVVWYIWDYHESDRQRSIVDNLRHLVNDCERLGGGDITIRGQCLVWDMQEDEPSHAYGMLPKELQGSSTDDRITVFMVLPEKNELVSEQSYEITAVSVRSQVSNVKDAGAEVLVSACIPPTCAQIIKEADRLGWDPQIFINYTNSDPMMFLSSSPELMEGIITLQGNKLSTWTDDPAVAEHHRIMKEYSDFPPGNFTIVGSAAAALTVEVLSRTCDNLTRQALMDAVHSIKDYQGDLTLPGITQTLSPTDHYATEAMRMLRAHDGEWEYFGDIISFRD